MPITVTIANESKSLDEATERWIADQLRESERTGSAGCVRVMVQEGGLNMNLSTPSCGSVPGGSRQATPQEQEIFNLWNARGLDKASFSAGNVNAFLKQLRNHIR